MTDGPSHDRSLILAWPGWPRLAEASLYLAVCGAYFALTYGGADYLAGLRDTRLAVDLEFEQQIPFVVPMIGVYITLNLLFLLTPFVLRTSAELRAMAWSFLLASTIAGICFVVFPAELSFPPPQPQGFWSYVYGFADVVNLDYNLVPSLHVTFALLFGDVFARKARGAIAFFFWGWAAAIGLSTLLTHQHHLLDVVTGALLGLGVSRLCYARWVKAAETRATDEAEESN